jgi:hypothetical protein
VKSWSVAAGATGTVASLVFLSYRLMQRPVRSPVPGY